MARAAIAYVLADIYGVQGIGSAGMFNKNFKLGGNIDASGTANWNNGTGFVPIGNLTGPGHGAFAGTFDRSK